MVREPYVAADAPDGTAVAAAMIASAPTRRPRALMKFGTSLFPRLRG
jgi:hypothetical protein